MKRLSVFLMAAALGISSLSCPASVFARNPVVQNGVGADNFTIKTTFSDGLDAGSLDVYRIFFRLLDEDSRMPTTRNFPQGLSRGIIRSSVSNISAAARN